MIHRWIFTVIMAIVSMAIPRYSQREAVIASTKYAGGRSTSLQAIVKIGIQDRIPIGVMFGSRNILCEPEIEYDFTGLSSVEALRKISKESSYLLIEEDGAYNFRAPDLYEREKDVVRFSFPRFGSSPSTMSALGYWLTGYISSSIEGSSGFAISSLGRPEDEILTVATMMNVTTPQIANRIVRLGSKGLWTMHAGRSDKDPVKPGSTVISMYSYHDSPESLKTLTCPASP